MINPVIRKIPADKTAVRETTLDKLQKQGPSRFDNIRSEVDSRAASSIPQLPPNIANVSLDQQRRLESDLRRRLQQNGNKPSPEIFNRDLAKANEGVAQLRRKVEALPKASVFEPLRLRFSNVEAMIKQTGPLVRGINSSYSPAEMMKVQVQMYQLSENLELLVKAVEETNTGMKSIPQTQI